MGLQRKTWCIQVTFFDEVTNEFLTLGGAAWYTKAEWELAWNSIEEAPMGWYSPSNLCADKLDDDLNQLTERPITASTAERLLGKPISTLIVEGRANTCFTLGSAKVQTKS